MNIVFKTYCTERLRKINNTVFGAFAAFLLLLFFISCASSVNTENIKKENQQALQEHSESEFVRQQQNDKSADQNDLPGSQTDLTLKPYKEKRLAVLRIFPADAEIKVLSSNMKEETIKPFYTDKDKKYFITNAAQILVQSPGYKSLMLDLPEFTDKLTADNFPENKKELIVSALPECSVSGSCKEIPAVITEAKLEKTGGLLEKIGEAASGYQPKSVIFTPDGSCIYTAYLGSSTAMGKYSIDPFKKIDELNVPKEYRAEAGFVEMAILPEKNEIWVSQMTTNMLHVFSLVSGNWIKAVPVSGKWVKVLLPSPDESRIYASCWDSKTICEIDTEKKVELRSFSTSGIPRGLAFTPDGKGLLAAIFSSSGVDVINLSDGKIEKTLNAAPGHIYAMRHIVHDEKRKEYYITAMGAGKVYRLSDNFEWIGCWQVGDKPNTCAISPDGKWLFVSCRGPNNPDKGYLYKGYEFGKVYFIDLENKKVNGWIWGMDQPTGLAVSPDGKYLAFSDFLSSTLELYRIKE